MINKIARSKYKVFHFINLLYYFIFFGVGFICGLGLKNILLSLFYWFWGGFMKKMVLGIILSLSVTFAIGISKVNAYAFDLPLESSYEQARHLWDDSWSATLGNEIMNQLCFYVRRF